MLAPSISSLSISVSEDLNGTEIDGWVKCSSGHAKGVAARCDCISQGCFKTECMNLFLTYELVLTSTEGWKGSSGFRFALPCSYSFLSPPKRKSILDCIKTYRKNYIYPPLPKQKYAFRKEERKKSKGEMGAFISPEPQNAYDIKNRAYLSHALREACLVYPPHTPTTPLFACLTIHDWNSFLSFHRSIINNLVPCVVHSTTGPAPALSRSVSTPQNRA